MTEQRRTRRALTVFADIVIPRKPPTPNLWTTKHWRFYYDVKKIWGTELRHALGFASPPATGRRIIEAQRELGPRERPFDHDNALGGLKPIIDGLEALGWVVSDARHHLRVVVVDDRRTPHSGLRLVIRSPHGEEWGDDVRARVLLAD